MEKNITRVISAREKKLRMLVVKEDEETKIVTEGKGMLRI